MKREDFINVAEETLDSLPEEFRSRIQNVAILVEDFPPNQSTPQPGQRKRLLLGIFHGVPATKRSVFNLPTGPDHIVLYQKNIEAVCSSEAEVRHQIRQTLIHVTEASNKLDAGSEVRSMVVAALLISMTSPAKSYRGRLGGAYGKNRNLHEVQTDIYSFGTIQQCERSGIRV